MWNEEALQFMPATARAAPQNIDNGSTLTKTKCHPTFSKKVLSPKELPAHLRCRPRRPRGQASLCIGVPCGTELLCMICAAGSDLVRREQNKNSPTRRCTHTAFNREREETAAFQLAQRYLVVSFTSLQLSDPSLPESCQHLKCILGGASG
jgi:hypothetical protein